MTTTFADFYDTGTIALTAASTAVVGTGVLWNDVVQGDILQAQGLIGIVNSVSGAGLDNITLRKVWPGTTASGVGYTIIKLGKSRFDTALTQAKLRELLLLIGNSTIIYAVKAPATVPDPGLGNDGDYAIKTDGGAWKQWLKVAGVWVLQATPLGINNLGVWSGVTSYVPNDVVSRLSTTYISISSNLNKPPESNPSDWSVLGAQGNDGADGADGATGAAGITPAMIWTFSTSVTDSDPGNGNFRISNASYAAATFLYFDILDALGSGQSPFLNLFDDSTDPVSRGTLFLKDSTTIVMFTITGDVTAASGYYKVPVSYVASGGVGFSNGASVTVSFSRTGNRGSVGASGGTGAAGATGMPGADGKTTRYGSGAPSNLFGNDGDFYIDVVGQVNYGPKASGIWPAGTSRVGPQGLPGAAGQGLQPDATGTLAQRGTYDGQPIGFKFLETDVVPFLLWVKQSNTSADWGSATPIGGSAPLGSMGSVADSVSSSFSCGAIA